jgi:superfamily II DNA or RNA helicase
MSINRNTTNIFKFINDNLDVPKESNNSFLNPHQKIVSNFFTNIKFNDVKGNLIYHLPGSGKTIISIDIAIKYLEKDNNKNNQVFIILNKSLQSNYKNDIKKYLKELKKNDEFIENYINNNFKFFSMNSYNLSQKLEKENLKNKLIIVDECHNMFNAIVNGSENMTNVYNIFKQEPSLSLLFMTGTPIINNPYELTVCFNMLSKITLFPENYLDFLTYFIEIDNPDLFNLRLSKLGNRIIGMVSYFAPEITKEYPTDLGIEIVNCIMTSKQLDTYIIYKNIEREKAINIFSKNKNKSIGIAKNVKNSVGSDYKIKTRMLCNSYSGDDINDVVKFNEIYKRIIPNTCTLIYSQFTNTSGLGGLSLFLKAKGYKLFNETTQTTETTNYDTEVNKILKKGYFAIISGDIDFNIRENIQKVFNNSNNKYGEIISILLISSTGAEGLDLKNIRSVHLLEPYWNYSRILQTQARAIRYKSHIELKEEEQNVKTYIYLSKQADNKTTDEEIYDLSVNAYELIKEFLNIMKKYSYDCSINYFDCPKCNVTEKLLYRPDFNIDINISNPCDSNLDTEIEVEFVKNNIYKDKKNNMYKLVNNELVKI